MTSETKTLPGQTRDIGLEKPRDGVVRSDTLPFATVMADFPKISHLLSPRELRRPRAPEMTGAEMKRIAKKNPPPPEWHEGEDERPF